MNYTMMETRWGPLMLAEDRQGLHTISFLNGKRPMSPHPDWTRVDHLESGADRQLAEYFRGERQAFDLVYAHLGTEFQRQVWEALDEIPYGVTVSYADIARKVGRPRATRAVGAANGRNPWPIVRPCHRVIGSNGTLTGYGGGLAYKEGLLAWEAEVLKTFGGNKKEAAWCAPSDESLVLRNFRL